MISPTYPREILSNGTVRLTAEECSFVFSRPAPGILLVTVAGHDRGQFGMGALDEIVCTLNRERPLELFVDTREAVGVAVNVRQDWTRFFAGNRANLSAVHVLTRSKIVHLAVAVAQLFSRTGDLIRLYSQPEAFQARLDRARDSSVSVPRP